MANATSLKGLDAMEPSYRKQEENFNRNILPLMVNMKKLDPAVTAYMKELSLKGLKARRKKYGKDVMLKARQARKFDKTNKSVV